MLHFYAECHNAECRYAQCHYPECRGATLATFRGCTLVFLLRVLDIPVNITLGTIQRTGSMRRSVNYDCKRFVVQAHKTQQNRIPVKKMFLLHGPIL